MSVLSRPEFHDEEAAYAYVDARIWVNGRVCPHCGVVEKSGKLGGKSTRAGVYKCYACRKPFTVKIGTIFEASHVAMNLWLQAIYLMAASKKGISCNQLHRTLGVTLKTAWFMSHRIREAMRDDGSVNFGSGGGVVEVDETFIGREPGKEVKRGVGHKMKVLTLVDRGTGLSGSRINFDHAIFLMAALVVFESKRPVILSPDQIRHAVRVRKQRVVDDDLLFVFERKEHRLLDVDRVAGLGVFDRPILRLFLIGGRRLYILDLAMITGTDTVSRDLL